MKDADAALVTYLNTSKTFQSCDLYEIALSNGNTYYYTDADADITYNGKTFSHNKALLSRDQVKLNSSVNVDTLTVSVYADKDDTLDGTIFFKAAHNGALDLATLTLRRCFFEGTAIKGVIGLFSGWIEVKSCGGLKLELTVKAKTTGLSQDFPLRKYYPDGTYTNTDGTVTIDSSTDEYTLVTPFIPLSSVLY